MGFKIIMGRNYTGEHMGLSFTQGTAHTEDAFLASRLQSKGYKVTPDESVDGEAVSASDEITEEHAAAAEAGSVGLEEMTVPQLKEYAAKNGIDLGGARTKAEFVSAIYAAEADKEVQ
ncbi:MAG: SAP domain-containing protein [Oscillospiraceae bacterium]|nr:SAP domain-containing protein [Oscillospiraceae bacterium]